MGQLSEQKKKISKWTSQSLASGVITATTLR